MGFIPGFQLLVIQSPHCSRRGGSGVDGWWGPLWSPASWWCVRAQRVGTLVVASGTKSGRTFKSEGWYTERGEQRKTFLYLFVKGVESLRQARTQLLLTIE